MTMLHYKKAFVAVVLLHAGQASSRAVCAECFTRSPCDALEQSSVVFVGDVIEASPPAEKISETQSKAVPQAARFKIVERFKGVPPDRQGITAKIAFSSAETVFVTAGSRYLVYARERSDGTWDTSCSRTKPLPAVSQELEQLRQCRAR